MSTMNEDSKQNGNIEALKQQAPACGPGCACNAAGPAGKARWIAGAIILVAAAAFVARAMIKSSGVSADKAEPGFATAQVTGQTPASDVAVTPSAVDTVKEIAALSDLNAVAADADGVFVFIPDKSVTSGKAPTVQLESAMKTIESNGYKIGIFTMKTNSSEYDQIAAQVAVPGVLAMVKGGGISVVSGEVTETKLVQAFVASLNAGGCGPSGCGPSGCK